MRIKGQGLKCTIRYRILVVTQVEMVLACQRVRNMIFDIVPTALC